MPFFPCKTGLRQITFFILLFNSMIRQICDRRFKPFIIFIIIFLYGFGSLRFDSV